MNKTILIVEDDADILKANCKALKLEGYHVLAAQTLSAGRELMEREGPDLVILDILLPDGNGLDYCEELRGRNSVPILFISALNTNENIVAGLRAGGDFYFPKPYDMDVFLAQVDAILRRDSIIGHEDGLLYIGELKLDTLSRRAFLNEQDLLLKPREFAVLEILAKNKDTFFSAEQLFKTIWGMDTVNDTRTIKEHISRLRRKLGYSSSIRIESERGKGYCLKQVE